jgi:hypothetical protein
VNDFGRVPRFLEMVRDLVGAMLGAREYENPRHRLVAEQAAQESPLVLRVDEMDGLLDAVCGDRRR